MSHVNGIFSLQHNDIYRNAFNNDNSEVACCVYGNEGSMLAPLYPKLLNRFVPSLIFLNFAHSSEEKKKDAVHVQYFLQ